jgi:hypothetical protein
MPTDLPPPLTWPELRAMPERTKLEVYATGTGLWLPARVEQWDDWTDVVPDDSGGMLVHYVVGISDSDPEEVIARRLLLVRRPMPKGLRVPDGEYRDMLKGLSLGLARIFRKAGEEDEQVGTLGGLKALVRYLLKSGGFTRDLWAVFKDEVAAAFAPPPDDPLAAILAELEAEKS